MQRFPILLFFIFIAAACVQQPGENEVPVRTFTATSEYGPDTRTSLDGFSVTWAAGDMISIFNQATPLGEQYTINDADAGKTTASFSGADTGAAPWYALYPADGAASVSEGKLSLTLSGVQEYCEGSFGLGANPMVAVSSSGTLNFKNLCGILQLNLTGSGVIKTIMLTTLAQEALWGSAQVALDYSEAPVLEVTQPVDIQHRSITLDCGNGVELGETALPFYFVLPVGTLSSGFTVFVSGSDNNNVSRSTSTNLSITRSSIKSMRAFDCTLASSAFTSLSNYGVYDLSARRRPKPLRVFGSRDQLALRTGEQYVFRIQSLIDANAVSIRFPSSLTEGDSYELSIESVGLTGVEDAVVQAILLHKEDGICWFENKQDKLGYIIASEL